MTEDWENEGGYVNRDDTPLSEQQESNDAFAPENIGAVSAIIGMRIYDVLMSLLMVQDSDAADRLLSLHASGALMGPSPSLSGNFIFDIMNSEQS
jgi:hypothetical protein